jgi:hypothetical protein
VSSHISVWYRSGPSHLAAATAHALHHLSPCASSSSPHRRANRLRWCHGAAQASRRMTSSAPLQRVSDASVGSAAAAAARLAANRIESNRSTIAHPADAAYERDDTAPRSVRLTHSSRLRPLSCLHGSHSAVHTLIHSTASARRLVSSLSLPSTVRRRPHHRWFTDASSSGHPHTLQHIVVVVVAHRDH